MGFRDETWVEAGPGLRALRRGTRPIRHIQIFGQRCSGTNALARLLEGNFGTGVPTRAYGFKHWFVPEQTLFHEEVLVLVVARNVFDWLRSLHRQPWHAHPELKSLPFAEFIRSPWHSYWDDEFGGIGPDHPLRGLEMPHERDPITGERFRHPIAKRTAKLRHWSELGARAHNVALLSHQALEDDPAGVVEALARLTGLSPLGAFQPVWSYKGNNNRAYEPTRYEAIDPADLAFIGHEVDPEIEARFSLLCHPTEREAPTPGEGQSWERTG
ncbi:hypothetical protein [Aureimonas sp. ME7]|uniref:hypothetical protein n=1 Tax=Aureimonas sp. ME7 TaxID=2744252 RepID=UPI0015F50471|nr:hypothetical protein [Aureimonas sp. ME7]